MISPVAGPLIAFLCVVVMRGISAPFVVLATSIMADESAAAPDVLIPTP
jgi:hypothetical protein